MADDPKPTTQKTPKGHEIPVPAKADFLRDLKKVAPAPGRPKDKPASS